ncbi:MAG: DinB family protein [Ignavibacteria bacterium]|nr:DinB family protein [Ignavibacteria bacterium]
MNDRLKLMEYMLEDIRKVTLSGVSHLSKEQLFTEPLKGEFPIGAYLLHFAECEISWLEILSGISQPEDLKQKAYYNKWYDPLGTGEPPSTPPEISYYLDVISEARKNLTDYMAGMKDAELEENVTMKRKNGDHTLQKKWIIYHLLEHEAHHRGQMFMLLRMAGMNKKNENRI